MYFELKLFLWGFTGCIQNIMTDARSVNMEGVERNKVRLLAHNNEWVNEFLQVKSQIETIWCNNILDIQHVGSTAIFKICAKPILDIAVLLKSIDRMDVYSMKQMGYEYCGPQSGSDTYHLYVLRNENQLSLRHIHCYDVLDKEFFQLVGFRDYLNSHSDVARKYQELKESLAAQYPDDRIAYTNGKSEFIQNIYTLLDSYI